MLALNMVKVVPSFNSGGVQQQQNQPLSPLPLHDSVLTLSPTRTTLTTPLTKYKGHPVCDDETLKGEAMSVEELSELCFPKAVEVVHPQGRLSLSSDSSASASSAGVCGLMSSSSSCTSFKEGSSNVCNYVSDAESSIKSHHHLYQQAVLTSEELNAKILSRTLSRQGRSTQRWVADPQLPNSTIRLVTGCIPIVKGGKVLFVSANKKPEWIFPKGGWESDESMQESAIRESFEEAGVIGNLGPKLSEVQYETRKARKRRIELEEMVRRANKKERPASSFEDSNHNTQDDSGPDDNKSSHHSSLYLPSSIAVAPIHDKTLTRIRETHRNSFKQSDETSSMASDASGTYTHVRMTLFPLYVSDVKEKWPESGRCRKAVDIDEAIKLLDNRPELQTALKEVKQKGLHLKI